MAMNKRVVLFLVVVIVVSIIASALLVQNTFSTNENANAAPPSVYVGVDLAYGNLAAVESQINQMSHYINLVVLGSTGITYSSQLNSVCQFMYDKGLYFILYTEGPPSRQWLQNALSSWGNHFLGLYAFDEPGGRQLDQTKGEMTFKYASNYTDAAATYNAVMTSALGNVAGNFGDGTSPALFTSDYVLYWFDYKAGYDTLFAELGWNYSKQLNIDLVRGAAEVQNRSWGVMIDYTYTAPPYIESAPDLYGDMMLAYDSGAKYILVFDSNPTWTGSILDQQHLNAMQQFWAYMQANPQPSNSPQNRTAFVLPADYGYGFRGPTDKIWGLWQADNFTLQLCGNLSSALQQCGSKLDIIYDDPAFPNYSCDYGKLIFWNGTVTGGG
jgi:hypothetical protein